ncbi:Hypothetical predicted protein [Olea europaea subsp. europaea]|uniref:Uncharacterized protein n=1 Tax=Olea europaea subsp. europaea TaxID=158383 RepID=A0A8S0QJD5_OLEEU|nr:Hypothetical predicted protein [Olea europaea subsp. europaea]
MKLNSFFSLNINGWEMMISLGLLAAVRHYNIMGIPVEVVLGYVLKLYPLLVDVLIDGLWKLKLIQIRRQLSDDNISLSAIVSNMGVFHKKGAE